MDSYSLICSQSDLRKRLIRIIGHTGLLSVCFTSFYFIVYVGEQWGYLEWLSGSSILMLFVGGYLAIEQKVENKKEGWHILFLSDGDVTLHKDSVELHFTLSPNSKISDLLCILKLHQKMPFRQSNIFQNLWSRLSSNKTIHIYRDSVNVSYYRKVCRSIRHTQYVSNRR